MLSKIKSLLVMKIIYFKIKCNDEIVMFDGLKMVSISTKNDDSFTRDL